MDNIDWTKVWSNKYPILKTYKNLEKIGDYEEKISTLYNDFSKEFQLSEEDTVLILKDILYNKYKSVINSTKIIKS